MNRFRDQLKDVSGLGLIDVLVSLMLLSIGVLSVAGTSRSVGEQVRLSSVRTDQSAVALQTMATLRRRGYAAATGGAGIVFLGRRAYRVSRTVTSSGQRVKVVRLTVTPESGPPTPRIFTSRVYATRPLPSAP